MSLGDANSVDISVSYLQELLQRKQNNLILDAQHVVGLQWNKLGEKHFVIYVRIPYETVTNTKGCAVLSLQRSTTVVLIPALFTSVLQKRAGAWKQKTYTKQCQDTKHQAAAL